MTLDNLLVYSSEVKAALADAKPVVAMESTIISHGMPYPQNVKMAGTVEQIIRDNGATPATIAIMDGKIRIGLEPEDLQTLATAEDVAKNEYGMAPILLHLYNGYRVKTIFIKPSLIITYSLD